MAFRRIVKIIIYLDISFIIIINNSCDDKETIVNTFEEVKKSVGRLPLKEKKDVEE